MDLGGGTDSLIGTIEVFDSHLPAMTILAFVILPRSESDSTNFLDLNGAPIFATQSAKSRHWRFPKSERLDRSLA